MLVMGDPERAGVERQEVIIPGEPDVRCLVYLPRKDQAEESRAAYLHIHGGGYVLGEPEGSDIANIAIAEKLNVVVCSVAYRLAPEHPIPAPLDDCYTALQWLHQNAPELGVDRNRIAIGGESAGGGMAAALAIQARDRGEYHVCHQHLTYPMLDHRTGTDEMPGDPLTGEFIWTRERNQFGWSAYLGEAERAAPQVPALVDDFTNLPPTWMFTAALDLFRDENIAYASSLLKAGVPTELFMLPGACHGFQMVPGTNLGRRYREVHMDALAAALRKR